MLLFIGTLLMSVVLYKLGAYAMLLSIYLTGSKAALAVLAVAVIYGVYRKIRATRVRKLPAPR